VAADFLTLEVWTVPGLVGYHVLFGMKWAAREVHIAGMTYLPNRRWME
jgi:hypothetical protein